MASQPVWYFGAKSTHHWVVARVMTGDVDPVDLVTDDEILLTEEYH